MKSLKSIGVLALFFSLALFALSCGGDSHSHEHGDHDGHSHDATEASTEAAAKHGEGTAYTAAYVCPMHCEGSGGEAAGKCPACGMDYVAQAEHVKNGHTH